MAYRKDYYEKNRDKHNARSRSDYQKHREKRLATLKEKRANRTKEQHEEDKKKMREAYQRRKLTSPTKKDLQAQLDKCLKEKKELEDSINDEIEHWHKQFIMLLYISREQITTARLWDR